MKINGHEVDFDMDIRKDYAKFKKSYALLLKKQENNKKALFTDDDMENFLVGCLKPEDTKTLLSDGRLSTLTKVFTEFFSNTIDQYGEICSAYEETAESLVDMRKRAESVATEYQGIADKVASVEMADAEPSGADEDVS